MKLFRIFVLALFALTLIACGGAEERKAVYMEKAKASIEAGDLDKARIELKNALQIDPKYSEAYFQIGKVFELRQEYKKAYANYLKAEELDPANLANQAKLGWFYLFLINDKEKAQEKIDIILSADKNNSEGLLLKASMLLKNDKKAEALVIAKAIVNKEPSNVDAAIFLSKLYLNNKEFEKSSKVLDNALSITGDNKRLNQLLGLVLVNGKDYERAEVIYKKLFEEDPDKRSNYKILAAFYNTIDNKDEAERILRDSIDNDPNDVDRYFDLIKYISIVKGNEVAIDELKIYVDKNNTMEGLRIALAEYYYVNRRFPEAINIYERTIKDFPESETGIVARIALATIYLAEKNTERARELVDEAIVISPNNPDVNMMRAKIAIFDKDVEKAIIALRIVLKETPGNVDAYVYLARAHMTEGDKEQAKSVLDRAYENNKNNPASLLKLSKIYLRNNPFLAEKIIDDYNRLKENDYEGLSIKSVLLTQKKNTSESYDIASILIDIYPDLPNGYLQTVPYHLANNDKQQAISILEKGYRVVKDNRKILNMLVSLQVSIKQFDAAKKKLTAEIEASPDDASLKIRLSKVYYTENKIDASLSLLNSIVENTPESEESYLLIAKIYQKRKDYSSAIAILKKGGAELPDSKKIPLTLATIYDIKNDNQKALNVYKEMYKKHPDDLILVNNFVALLSDYGNDDDLVLAESLVPKLEKSGELVFMDTVGWVSYKRGNYQEAIQLLSRSVEKMPDINVFNYHLGMAYSMSGDKKQAKKYLEKSLANDKDFKEKSLAKAALKNL